MTTCGIGRVTSAIVPAVMLMLAAGSPVLAQTLSSASGHGQISDGKETQVVSFGVTIQADGAEQGQAEIFNRTTGLRLHVDVDCVRIEKGTVTFSGNVTQSTDPKFINDQVIIQSTDNGEGVEDKPDTLSVLQIADQAKCVTCKTPLKFHQAPIERGNIQVRP